MLPLIVGEAEKIKSKRDPILSLLSLAKRVQIL
jgi:hypothetical protein